MKRLFLALLLFTAAASPIYASTVSEYEQNIDNYRSLYAEFLLRRSEFRQFGTFTSEEELTKIAAPMLLARADVWIAYWNLLAEQTKPLTILQPTIHSKVLDSYQNEVKWLTEHKQKINELKRRDQLNTEANRLNLKIDQYTTMASQGTALVYIGRLLSITNDLLQLNTAITERVQTQSFNEEVKSMKLRGLQVNKDNLQVTYNQLAQLEADYSQEQNINSESVERIQQKLEPMWSRDKQLRQVLAEIAEGVEW